MEKTQGEIIKGLTVEKVQHFIREHEHHDVRDLILKHKEILGVPATKIADQIIGLKKAREKLPLYFKTPKIIYPPAINLEQSSSEQTALYKKEIVKNLFPDGRAFGVDLTGGFGVDTFFLSKVLHQMHYVEPQKFLLEIARHNHERLGADNMQYHANSAEDFIKKLENPCNIFFIDPSRRTKDGIKILPFENTEPNVVSLKNEIFKKGNLLLIKASPLLDIQAGCAQLNEVQKIFVIAVKGECREILFLCKKNFTGIPLIETVNILAQNTRQLFQFTLPEEKAVEADFSDPLKYLYEPNAAILKAGAFKIIANHFNLKKIQVNTHLYTSRKLVPGFPGRKFLIEKIVRPDANEIQQNFPEGKANITTRNYPLTVEALKKRTGLQDGGDKYLIGFSGQHKKYLVSASRIK